MPIPASFSSDQLPYDNHMEADVELLHMVAISSNDGIWDWHMPSGHVNYSDRWLELVGLQREGTPMHVDTFQSRLHPDDTAVVQQELDNYLHGDAKEYRFNFRLQHADGSWRWIASRGVVIRDARGQPVRLAGTHTDITDRMHSAERLERLVAERTQELKEARDKAESNAAATAKFLAATSHDVSQPLQAASLLLGSLHQEITSNTGRAMLQAVERSIAACTDLLESLLEFSRLDAGAMRPHMASCDAGELLESVAASFAADAMRRRLRLHVVPPRVPLRTDARLLGRILRNLVSNALKYTERGAVLVGARRLQHGLRIEVWDTGRGIPGTQLNHVFREFVRLPDGRDAYAPGLGLGLAIVERLAKLMGHKLTVRSWPGRGSVFSVEVPYATPIRPSAHPHSPLPPPPEPLSPLPPRKVLLLEDNPEIAHGLRLMLEGLGWQVWHGTSLPAALHALGHETPNFLIADWHMDGPTDGFASYDALEARYGPLPGFVLTGHYDATELAQANTRQRRVLFKPVTPKVLHAVLCSLVR